MKALRLSALVAAMLFAIPRLVFGEDLAAEIPFNQWFNDAVQSFLQLDYKALKGWALASTMVAMAVRFLISSMKVSFLRQMLWDKLPVWAKYVVAPVLSLIVVLFSIQWPTPLTLMSVLTAVGFALISGSGAIALHSLLRYIESLPGVSVVVKSIVGFLANLLGARLPKDAQYPVAK